MRYRITVREAGALSFYRVANAQNGRQLFEVMVDAGETFLDDAQIRAGVRAFMRTLGSWTEVRE